MTAPVPVLSVRDLALAIPAREGVVHPLDGVSREIGRGGWRAEEAPAPMGG